MTRDHAHNPDPNVNAARIVAFCLRTPGERSFETRRNQVAQSRYAPRRAVAAVLLYGTR